MCAHSKTKGKQRKLKASFLKILHAFMYDPFYEFFDLISVFGYVEVEATDVASMLFQNDGVYIHFVYGWIIMCAFGAGEGLSQLIR